MCYTSISTKKHYYSILLLWILFPLMSLAQNGKTLTGTVQDETGEGLIGATIVEVGSSKGTVTDFDGNFSLQLSSAAKTVQVSYVGYKTKVLQIPSSGHLNIQMEPDQNVIQETVVIGYGVQRKSDLTGSVSNVSSKDFNQGVINSPEQLINGKVSGVQIVNSGGSPSAESTIRIRGGASLNASNDPLIVLDGVPMEVGGSVSGSGNFLSLINPNDIESMTHLERCVVNGYLWFACIKRCHYHHDQERHRFEETKDQLLHYQLVADAHQDGRHDQP